MPARIREDATITTTFGKIMEFAIGICRMWSPAFYLSITRDGKKEFSDERFNGWFYENIKHINWDNLYPENVCGARLKSGRNRGMRCNKKVVSVVEDKVASDGSHYQQERDSGFCGIHKKLVGRKFMQEEAKRVTTNNKISSVKRFVGGLPGATDAYRDYFEFNEKVEKQDIVVEDPDNVINEIEYATNEPSKARYEDVATEEQVKERDEKLARKHDELVRKLEECDRKYEEGDRIAEENNERFTDLANSIEDGSLVQPTKKDISESYKPIYLTPGQGVVVTRDDINKRNPDTKGVGSKESVVKDGPLMSIDSSFVSGNDSITQDRGLEEKFKSKMSNRVLCIPFHDPATDPIQDHISQVKVKAFGGSTLVTWVEYYDYLFSVTVWDPDTYKLQPYSFALIKCDDKGMTLNEWFEMDDTDKILSILNRFDNFMLLELLITRLDEDVKKIFFANNTILGMEIFGFKVMDLCRMLNMPLAKACKAFKCEQQKLSLDHSQVQSMFMSGRLQGYMQDNYSKIREYNMMDVKTLSELYFKTRYELKRLCEVNIEEHMTLAGMSYRIFKDLNKKIEFPLHGDSEKKLLCKLLMNSLSGKLIQKDYNDVIEIVKTREELISGTLQQYINKMPTIYGALIYSYARSHMYDTILSKVKPSKLFGMDTDSAFITVGQYNELFKKYPEIFGNEFGQFKEEIIELVDSKNEDGPFGIFVAPKCYCFYGRNKKTGKERFVKARFKGINIDRDRIWDTSVDYNKLTASEVHDLYYQETLPKIDVDFYRRCLKENVTILHSNLAKTIMNVRGAGEEHEPDFINIKQHFCLKVIKHNA
ncbi:hypothetical protein IW138_006465 [Coemansia sp. RSA 986]|nr:hypothetical protein IW138_006465 [Coemansia sp. RSA 986]